MSLALQQPPLGALFFLAILMSCSDFGVNTNDSIYSGITSTNDKGEILSVDPDDWGCSEQIVQPDTTIDTITGILLPTAFCFGPAYPNPANTVVIFPITIPTPSLVRLWVSDGRGFSVELMLTSLVKGEFVYEWNLKDINPGIYRAHLDAGSLQRHGDVLIK